MTEDHNIINNQNEAAATTLNTFDCQSAVLKLLQQFHAIVMNEHTLEKAATHLLNELIDDAIFGVFLEIHHLHKTGNLIALDGMSEDKIALEIGLAVSTAAANAASTNLTNTNTASNSSNSLPDTTHVSTASSLPSPLRIVDMPNYDIFGISTAKKPMECTCPNCERLVSAARFAPHLEKCMGMGRLSSRIASRRLATKDISSNSSNNMSAIGACGAGNTTLAASSAYMQLQNVSITDDEDDVDWSEKRRKKSNNNSRNNGSKKNNGKVNY